MNFFIRYHPLYSTWHSMIRRCTNPKYIHYDRYGGRGITVCERWYNFELFVEDMGERPAGHTIERIENDGNYEPGNCRWATRKEQAQNRAPMRFRRGRKLQNIFRIPGTIRKHFNRWRYAVDILGKKRVYSFATKEAALECQSEVAYEREFHRMLGL